MSEAVLFVDDEEYILSAIGRLFADSGLTILTAANGRDALEYLSTNEIAVIVSDNMMPGIQGIELLGKVKERAPDTVKIMMTAYGDMTTAVAAINTSEVFRFIVKPWNDDALLEMVSDAVNRYRLVRSLRNTDEAVLRSLAQTIELKDPYTRGHCDRVASYALAIATELGIVDERLREIKYGSWLHDCGKIGVPDDILNHEGILNDSAFATIRNHPVWGAEVARQAHLSEVIVNIIHYHHERYDGTGYPNGLAGAAIPLEARIVAVADVYDALATDRPYRKAYPREKTFNLMMAMKGNSLDGELVDRLFDCTRNVDGQKVGGK